MKKTNLFFSLNEKNVRILFPTICSHTYTKTSLIFLFFSSSSSFSNHLCFDPFTFAFSSKLGLNLLDISFVSFSLFQLNTSAHILVIKSFHSLSSFIDKYCYQSRYSIVDLGRKREKVLNIWFTKILERIRCIEMYVFGLRCILFFFEKLRAEKRIICVRNARAHPSLFSAWHVLQSHQYYMLDVCMSVERRRAEREKTRREIEYRMCIMKNVALTSFSCYRIHEKRRRKKRRCKKDSFLSSSFAWLSPLLISTCLHLSEILRTFKTFWLFPTSIDFVLDRSDSLIFFFLCRVWWLW